MGSNDVLSQEEIENMLNGVGGDAEPEEADASAVIADSDAGLVVDDYLSKDEQDVLGEVGNICMGTSATTMFTLLGRKVTITTPSIQMHTIETLGREYPAPIVVVEVCYIEGLSGNNLLIMKDYDVALITNLLLGEDKEINEATVVLDEIHLSAIREVMNQMVGSSATSLADILQTQVNISTPQAKRIVIGDESISDAFTDPTMPIVKISFKMEIESLLTSEIMQVLPLDFAKQLVTSVMCGVEEAAAPAAETYISTAQPDDIIEAHAVAKAKQQANAVLQPAGNVIKEPQAVDVKMAQFPVFDNSQAYPPGTENLNMILDVPMRVTVELGKAKKKIKEILEFNTGSVVVLDKIAGEAVDILVNGKKIGKGEVVVIEDNYGVRITEIDISSPMELI